MLYALHAGLGVVLEEGLEARTPVTAHAGALLQDALPELGFRLFALERRLPQLTSVWLPEGVDDAKLRGELLHRFDIEVGGGLGDLAGQGLAHRPHGTFGPRTLGHDPVRGFGHSRVGGPWVTRPPADKLRAVSRYTQELLTLPPNRRPRSRCSASSRTRSRRGRCRARRRDRSRARGPRDAAREQSVLRVAAPGLEHAPRHGDARLRHRPRPGRQRGVQPARRPVRARARRLLAARDHDRVRRVGHRPPGRPVDRRRLLGRSPARPRRGVAAPPRRAGVRARDRVADGVRSGCGRARRVRRDPRRRRRGRARRVGIPRAVRRSDRDAPARASRSRATRSDACCASRKRSRSSTRRCPATRRRPTSTGS
jgi:hypothetical protein